MLYILTKCFIFNISILKQVTVKMIYICFSVTAFGYLIITNKTLTR